MAYGQSLVSNCLPIEWQEGANYFLFPPTPSSRIRRMFFMIRFLWNSTRGHRLTPWRSPYLLWRVETYCGLKTQQIGFLEFWEFLWRERIHLWRFLKWTAEMDRYVHPKAKSL